jgi:NADH-quinone oxidoreductase subunit G
MPTLIIDDRKIEVPAGTKVIEAAERLGIMIPRFCYHEALGAVGACRMCAVKFVQGPVKGLQMSCMVDAQDGMVVSSTDEEAAAFRRFIIELLMLNHPHDCPVCDEGGQCLLQDTTVSGGHGLRRFLGRKRTYRDQELGVFIAHEMNRCIHCYRCSRFYQEFAGYRDLGPLQIANRLYFGRFRDGQLESPFSGNLVDLCPTGVYTDKPARYKGRRWDFERAPSLCLHCSLGCNTIANARYREVVRVEARFNDAVNGYFICDRGRFGFAYAGHPRRPRRARVEGLEVTLEEAIQIAGKRLSDIQECSGGKAVACLGSLRSSLETQSMLVQVCRQMAWRQPDFFVDSATRKKVRSAAAQLDRQEAVSLRQVEVADFILAVGVDPVNEAPMLALAMRQAHRRGAAVAVIDPRPVSLPFPFAHLAVPTWDLERCLESLLREAGANILLHHPTNVPQPNNIIPGLTRNPDLSESLDSGLRRNDVSPEVVPAPLGQDHDCAGEDPMKPKEHDLENSSFGPEIRQQITKLAESFKACHNPVLICGTNIVQETTPFVVGACARVLLREKGKCGLFYTLPGANAFSAALLGSADDSVFQETIAAVERGEVKALIVVEADPLGLFPDRSRLEQALSRLELLLVMDYLPSPTARQAHLFLPTLTMFETGSSFINQEGRIQFAHPVYRGGTPVSQVGGGSHPPRVYSGELPDGEPKPAWQLLRDLAGALSVEVKIGPGESPLLLAAKEHPLLAGLQHLSYPVDGLRCLPESADGEQVPLDLGRSRAPDEQQQLQLLLVDATFGTEELSLYADVIEQVESEPCLWMHTDEAARLGFAEDDPIVLTLDAGTLESRVRPTKNMARGTLVLPRHRQLAWQKVKDFSIMLPLEGVKKR